MKDKKSTNPASINWSVVNSCSGLTKSEDREAKLLQMGRASVSELGKNFSSEKFRETSRHKYCNLIKQTYQLK